LTIGAAIASEYFFVATGEGSDRLLFGLGASFILLGAVLLEHSVSDRVPDSLVRLGDASYAIYLLHERQKQGAGRTLCLTLASALQTKGFTSMIVWVLEQNPSVSFYERLGAVQIARKVINIGGADLEEVAFGWPSLDRLIAAGDQA